MSADDDAAFEPPCNILYYIPHQRVDSGGPNVLLRIIRNLDRSRFQPLFLARSEGPLVDLLVDQKVEIIRSPVGSIGYRHPFRSISRLRHMRNLLRLNGIALVHTFDFGWNEDVVLAAGLCGIPVILHEHWGGEAHFQNLNRFAADKVLFCSQAQRDSFGHLDRVRKKSDILYNSVDLGRFACHRSSLRAELGFADTHLVIGTVAFVTREKGIDILLEAAALLAARWENLRVLVVGPFNAQQEDYCRAVKQRAVTSPLQGKVVFLGSRRDIPELLSCMDIFAFPSLWESFGLAPLEAMASRLPVVASRVGGIPELLVDVPESGCLVTPISAPAFAEAIEPFLSDSGLRRTTGDRARQSIIGRLDEPTISAQLERIYLETLAARSGG
jgi:glycosyltransferase involved in cell wall biosynthesis